ncbi:MAG: ABC transporter ATP-binding protein [Actinomycetes bacterium]|jgi:oligopeptide/dipeptide ABC transporter ATP-binding protein|nr:ABC transporter ATP-binding protein [Actinomycetes bacterium]
MSEADVRAATVEETEDTVAADTAEVILEADNAPITEGLPITDEVIFSVKHLKKYYPVGKRKDESGHRHAAFLHAVDDVSFKIYKGEILGVVGESGSGKSTLGRCLLNLIHPTAGTVKFKGQELSKLSRNQMKQLRSEMQMVFQNPVSSFNPKQSIRKALRNVAAFYGMDKEAAKARINELLELASLDPGLLSHRSNELSGGQLQRLAVVRALLPAPTFLMADEPVSALDVSVQAQVLNLFLDLQSELELTIMFISHELTVVEHVCDRVIVMYLGAVVEMGRTDDIFAHQLHPYSESLIASKPKAYPEEEKTHEPLQGEIPSAIDIPDACRFCTRCPKAIPGVCDTKTPELKEYGDSHWAACWLLEQDA